jgi:hypothetical protein
MLKSIYATRLLYVLSLLFVKISLLIFYLRLDHRRPLKYTVYGILFIVIGVSIASFFILAFSCYPPAKFWDVTGTAVDGKCMDPGNQQNFYEANGILNIITDVLIYVVPIPMLWGVRISTVCFLPYYFSSLRLFKRGSWSDISCGIATQRRHLRRLWTWNPLHRRYVPITITPLYLQLPTHPPNTF